MKVLSYLEYNQQTDGDLVPLWALDAWGNSTNFYSQPFKPEMIVELFEGWQEQEDYNYINKDEFGYCLIQCSDDESRWNYIKQRKTFATEYNGLYIPRTLDDFINDCQRAGIELIWRQK